MRQNDRLFLERNFPLDEKDSIGMQLLYQGLMSLGSQNAAINRLEYRGYIFRSRGFFYLTDKGRGKISAIKKAEDKKREKSKHQYEDRRRELERLKKKGY